MNDTSVKKTPPLCSCGLPGGVKVLCSIAASWVQSSMFNVQGLFFIGKSTLARIKCKCKNKFKKGFRIYSHQQINASTLLRQGFGGQANQL